MILQKKFNRREKTLLCILALLVLFAVYYFLVELPVSNTMSDLESNIEMTDTEIMGLEAMQQRMIKMKNELKDSHGPEIPEFDNLQEVMVFLHAVLPASRDFQFSCSEPSLLSPEAGIMSRAISIQFTAPSYESARETIDQLENCPYRCLLSGLQIHPGGKDGGGGSGKDARPITRGPVGVSLVATFFEYQAPSAAAADPE